RLRSCRAKSHKMVNILAGQPFSKSLTDFRYMSESLSPPEEIKTAVIDLNTASTSSESLPPTSRYPQRHFMYQNMASSAFPLATKVAAKSCNEPSTGRGRRSPSNTLRTRDN